MKKFAQGTIALAKFLVFMPCCVDFILLVRVLKIKRDIYRTQQIYTGILKEQINHSYSDLK
jgi:hypothetical protein